MSDHHEVHETKEIHRCEKCGKVKADVRHAPDVGWLLCNDCWFHTPPRPQGRTR